MENNRYIPLLLAGSQDESYEIRVDCEPWRFGDEWAHDATIKIFDTIYRLQIIWDDNAVTGIIGIDDLLEMDKPVVYSLIAMIFPRPQFQWYLHGYRFDRASKLLESNSDDTDLIASQNDARQRLKVLWPQVKDNPRTILFIDFEDGDESDE